MRKTPKRENKEELIIEKDPPVATMILNRPESQNALSISLSEEIHEEIRKIRNDSGLNVLVIKGAGDAFSSGDDISEFPEWGNPNEVMRRVHIYQRMANELEELDKITIGAVDGYAVGGGLEITMACDFVIATENSKWGLPEVDLGITPGWGGTTRLSRLIGRRRAKEVNMLGGLYSAKRAVELNLWNRVVPKNQLDEEIDELVNVILSKNQQVLRQLKFIINKGIEADLYTAQGFEALSAGMIASNSDFFGEGKSPHKTGRGAKAFEEKEDPWAQRRKLVKDFWTENRK